MPEPKPALRQRLRLLKRTILVWLAGSLVALAARIRKAEAEENHLLRLTAVGAFLYGRLPEIDPDRWTQGLTFIEGGQINVFPLPPSPGEPERTLRIPRFDFHVPERALYLIVGTIESASWEEARLYGVLRSDWERVQRDLQEIEEQVPNLLQDMRGPKPKAVVIRWGEPLTEPALKNRILGTQPENDT